MRNLVVGDPHARAGDLPECEDLLSLVDQVAEGADQVVFLGDLFDSFSLLHVEVVDLWVRWCSRLAARRPVVAIRGNHDGPHDPRPGVHALRSLESIPGVLVVDGPVAEDGILYAPYFREPAAFAAACRAHPECGVVYCHQEFDGARFEGGFYSSEGVPPGAIPQVRVVSGHIHAPQEFDKVWYPGSPRWLTAADANVPDRALWIVEHGSDASVLSRSSIPTDGACSPIVRLEEVPDAPAADPASFPPRTRVHVDLRGPAAWVAERAAAWGSRARVRTFVDRAVAPPVRESDGIGVAARKHLAAYQPRHGADPEALKALARARLGEVMRGA